MNAATGSQVAPIPPSFGARRCRWLAAGAVALGMTLGAGSASAAWVQTQTLGAPVANANEFGLSVAVSSDGNTIVVGSPAEGAVYVFTPLAGVWSLQQRITTGANFFGISVAIAGDTLAIGSVDQILQVGLTDGTVYVFTRAAGMWTQQASFSKPSSSTGGNYGLEVALAPGVLAVGAPATNTQVLAPGAVFAYTQTGTTWSGPTTLVPPTRASGDAFGRNLSAAGSFLFASSSSQTQNSSPVYVFTVTGATWSAAQTIDDPTVLNSGLFGTSLSVSGTRAIIGAPGVSAAFVYGLHSGAWVQQAMLTPSDGAQDFGDSVGLFGTTAIVGAGSVLGGANNAGYVFSQLSASGHETQILHATGRANADNFGNAAALGGSTAVFGAPGGSVGVLPIGAVYVFASPAAAPVPTPALGPSTPALLLVLGLAGYAALAARRRELTGPAEPTPAP
jgi:hypothetical protein